MSTLACRGLSKVWESERGLTAGLRMMQIQASSARSPQTTRKAGFNRFTLAYGLEYDFPRGVTGDYFHFPYPYLVDVPGYKVRVVRLTSNEGGSPGPLSDEERAKNFDALLSCSAPNVRLSKSSPRR